MNNNLIEDIDETYYNESLISDDYEDDEFEIESDVISSDNFYNYINEELRLVEVDRRSFSFKYKDEYVTGVPIYKMNDTNIIFNIDNKLRKINLDLVEFE